MDNKTQERQHDRLAVVNAAINKYLSYVDPAKRSSVKTKLLGEFKPVTDPTATAASALEEVGTWLGAHLPSSMTSADKKKAMSAVLSAARTAYNTETAKTTYGATTAVPLGAQTGPSSSSTTANKPPDRKTVIEAAINEYLKFVPTDERAEVRAYLQSRFDNSGSANLTAESALQEIRSWTGTQLPGSMSPEEKNAAMDNVYIAATGGAPASGSGSGLGNAGNNWNGPASPAPWLSANHGGPASPVPESMTGKMRPNEDQVRGMIVYATAGKIGDTDLEREVAKWYGMATSNPDFNYDELATKIGQDSTIRGIRNGGSSGQEGSESVPLVAAPNVGSSSSPSKDSSTSAPRFTLIKGDGGPKGPNELRGNGNAVFLVSSSGELFHVTAGLAEQMKSNGTWSEPVTKPQSEVDGMTLRMSLNHTAELGVLDIPQTGEFMLVKGDGPALSTNQLNGNGDAVYAIDKQGNKFHVTGAVAEQMQANNTWTTPAVLNQGTIDAKPPTGALASPTGGTAALSIPLDGNNVVPIAAGVAANIVGGNNSAGASVASSAPAPTLKLIRGNGPNLGTSQLFGNGAAVYAVLPDGTKLHVTAAMAEKLKEAGKWVEPVPQPQWEIDSTPPAGTLASVDGAVGGFDTPLHAPQASAPSPAPAPTPAAPAPTPQLSQSDRDQIAGMYRQYLGREASPNEIDHHGAGILNGSNNMAQINLNIANSPEAKNYQASVVAQADAAKIAGINAQVNSLFQQYVGRAADAEDLRIHGSALASGAVTADSLKQQLAAAPESQAYRSNLINNTFQKYVGRAADSADHQIHGTALASGAVDANKFVASIATAPEAVAYQNSVGMPKYTQ